MYIYTDLFEFISALSSSSLAAVVAASSHTLSQAHISQSFVVVDLFCKLIDFLNSWVLSLLLRYVYNYYCLLSHPLTHHTRPFPFLFSFFNQMY